MGPKKHSRPSRASQKLSTDTGHMKKEADEVSVIVKMDKVVETASHRSDSMDARTWHELKPFEDVVLEKVSEEPPPLSTPVINYEDINQNWLEKTGFLTDRITLSGATILQRTPFDNDFVFASVNLSSRNLRGITVLGFYYYIQHLDISYNSISDLSPLSTIPYLKTLDASHNKVTQVLGFTPPMYLIEADLSFNCISKIPELEEFWSLTKLNLSHNNIKFIQGLQSLKYLTSLDLSYNQIYKLQNLNNMNIFDLNLSYNRIECYELSESSGLWTLTSLRNLKLDHNCLYSLRLFQGTYRLLTLDLFQNEIKDLMEVNNLKQLKLLKELVMLNNEVTNWPRYREVVLYTLPSLLSLDGQEVDAAEKISARTLHTSDPFLSASKRHAFQTLLLHFNKPYISEEIVPIDQNHPPFFVITSPVGCAKTRLASRLAKKLNKYIRMGITHTTRPILEGEEDGVTHHYVDSEVFFRLEDAGYFVCSTEIVGYSFGLSYRELGAAFQENKGCIVSMNFYAGIDLLSSPYDPTLILAIPFNEEIHRQRLRNMFSVNMGKQEDALKQMIRNQYAKHENQSSYGVTLENGGRTNFKLYKMSLPKLNITESWCRSVEGSPTFPIAVLDEARKSSCLKNPSVTKELYIDDSPLGYRSTEGSVSEIFQRSSSLQENQTNDKDTEEYFLDEIASQICSRGVQVDELFGVDSVIRSSSSESSPKDVCERLGTSDENLLLDREVPSSGKRQDLTKTSSRSILEEGHSCTEKKSGDISANGSVEASPTNDSQPSVVLSETQVSSEEINPPLEYETLIDSYIETVINYREEFFRINRERPGLFKHVVNLDDLKTSFKELKRIIMDICRSHQRKRTGFESVYAKEMLNEKLKTFEYILKRSTNQEQLDQLSQNI